MSPTLRELWPVAAIYAGWVALSLALLGLGTVGPALAELGAGLIPLCLVLFMGLLSAACGLVSAAHQADLPAAPRLRRGLLLGSLAVGLGFYCSGRPAGGSSLPLQVFAAANLVVFGVLLGNALVAGLKQASELVAVCVVMATVDLVSVLAGPSKPMAAAVETFYRGGRSGPAPATDYLLVKIAIPGLDHLLPVVGVADVIMLAFLVGGALKFAIADNLAGPGLAALVAQRRVFPYVPWAAVGLTGAVLAAQGFNLILPALPVVALVFLGGTLPREPRMRRLQRTEWVVVGIGCMLLLGLALGGLLHR